MKAEILGVKIDKINLEEVLEKIKKFVQSNQQYYIVTPNPEFLMAAQKDEEFKNILNKADLSLPDGVGLKLASWYLKNPIDQRITGTDLVWGIAKLAAQENYSLYLLGARPGIAEKVTLRLKKKNPGLKIAGFESGCLSKDERMSDERIIQQINGSQPDILLVSFGAPKQEKWIYHNLPRLSSVKLAMGVGGAFDFISGKVKRAPKLIRNLGLEWLFRLLIQPWRIQRILTATLRFSLAIIKSKNRQKYAQNSR